QPATVDASLTRLLVYGNAELGIGGGGTVAGPAVIGRAGDNSRVRQAGGDVTVSSWLLVGGNNAANAGGAYTLDSGTLTASNGISVGWGFATSVGTFTQNGGTVETLDNAQGLQLGRAGGNGAYTLNGGTLLSTFGTGSTPYTYQTFTFGGGLFRARSNTSAQSAMTTSIADGRTALIDTQGYSVTFAGVISGPAAAGLTKTGAGKLTLSTANTYAGVTLISNGTLRVHNTSGSGTGASTVRVCDGATLDGTGTITGAVEVAAGGSLSGGADGAGTLTLTRTPALEAGARLRITANTGGTGCGLLHSDGDLDLSKLTLDLTDRSQFILGTYTVATCDGTLTGPFAAVTLPASYSVAYDYAGKTVRVTRGALYVSPDGDDGNGGTSWTDAKATPQAAVTAAGFGGTVLVTNGVYDTGNYENTRVLITNSVTLRSVVPRGAVIRGSGIATYGTSSAIRCVYMDSGLLDGFILEDGATSASSKWSTGGGGLAINSASVTATNCVIRNCKALRGGGVYYGVLRDCVVSNNVAEDSGGGNDNGTRYNCLFCNNTAMYGGGVFWGYYYNCVIRDNTATRKGGGAMGNPQYGWALYDCVIENNTAGESGGGVYDAILTRCTVRDNTCVGNGGGVALGTYTETLIDSNTASNGSGGGVYQATLYRCKVLSNVQTGSGGGGGMVQGSAYSSLFAGNSAKSIGGTWGVNLYGCTVAGNTAALENGPGIHYGGETIYNSVAFGNTGGQNVDLCDLTAVSTVSNTVAGSADLAHPGVALVPAGAPVFADPTQGDFTLCPGSAAINAGDNALNPASNTLDLAGAPRIRLGTIDAGAYEYATLCVATNGNDGNNGLSWGAAKQTIQAAVDAAETGMTVLVSNGVYNTGTRVTPVVPSTLNRLLITNAVTVKSLSGPEQTVIQGAGTYNAAGATRCVFMSAGILDGFTLEKGRTRAGGNAPTNEYIRGGGGVCIMTPAPGTVVRNCVIRNNESQTGGGVTGGQTGGIDTYAYRYNGTVVDCVITNNKAGYGGGIAYYSTFDRCLIAHNTATSQGGGAYDVKQGVNNSLFIRNTASSSAGGVYIGTLNNCTVTSNSNGGATGSASSYKIYLNNTIVWGNTLWEINPAGLTEVVNVCTSNPSFRDAANSDYRLAQGSPCINAGDNAKVAGTLDLAKKERVASGTVDIGAHEFPASVRVTFDVSPGVYTITGSSVMDVLVPATNQVYGSWFPSETVYYSGHEPARWTSQPGGTGAEIKEDTPLQSLDDHTVYLRWRVRGLIIQIR
ncbi:MAG: right-handed parallel beta-helix repeat-containing protein, partial [Kiritimatiellae bacterium]|nr:right-handed parallel beta-helix repeat-containing protein [Kiritimatiellia bacterium]